MRIAAISAPPIKKSHANMFCWEGVAANAAADHVLHKYKEALHLTMNHTIMGQLQQVGGT